MVKQMPKRIAVGSAEGTWRGMGKMVEVRLTGDPEEHDGSIGPIIRDTRGDDSIFNSMDPGVVAKFEREMLKAGQGCYIIITLDEEDDS